MLQPQLTPPPAGSRDPATLFETLDLLPQHQALMTTGGTTVRVNRWLADLLRRVPEGRYLEEALGSYARSIADARRPWSGAPGAAPTTLEYQTAAGLCLLWGWCVELDRYGLGRLVLMTVQPVDPEIPPDDTLRRLLGLTPKEVDVARLLAEGRTNAAIATALCISQHTARHHTEKVMGKLRVRSRAEVGPRLRSLPRGGRN
ncbi:MAG TPA: helix-turn-helix transcriptional regulator [Longimicrobiaceae bacterium]|jgi:DNA-binding CsgD family transcriptional regulator